MRARLVGIALSTGPRQARYVPIGHVAPVAPPPAQAAQGGLFDEPEDPEIETTPGSLVAAKPTVPAALRALLEDAGVKKVGHALKQAAVVLAEHGVTLAGIDVDTELAAYLLDANRSEPPLEALALEHLTYKACSLEDIVGKGAKAISPATVPAASLLTWAGERADCTGQIAPLVTADMSAIALL